jgi:hypothetical protein
MPFTKNQKKVKRDTKATLFVADDNASDEENASLDSEEITQEEQNDHLYELIRGVPTVVIQCLETTDDYIPVPNNYASTSNVIVKLKPAARVPQFTVSLPILAKSSSCKYLPRDSKNIEEKSCVQSKRSKKKNCVSECLNSSANSDKDEEIGLDEKDEKVVTDRFDQKGGKSLKSDIFGRNSGGA